LSFFWGIGLNFFMEVAKLRGACKGSWCDSSSRAPTSRCRCGHTADLGLVAHRTGRVQQSSPASRRWRHGRGTQSLHTNALDGRWRSTDFSARIARNTQLLLQQESGTRGDRPVGRQHTWSGLTYDLARRAWAHITEWKAAAWRRRPTPGSRS
jgi:methylmalonyl-CoA mutase